MTTREPLSRSGGFIGVISKIIPHSYAVEGYYRVMAANQSLLQILPQVGILLAFGLVFFLIAVRRFRYE